MCCNKWISIRQKTILRLLELKINNFQVTIDGPEYIHNLQRKHSDNINTLFLHNKTLNEREINDNKEIIPIEEIEIKEFF